jgi:predicted nucleic acid-binding protein
MCVATPDGFVLDWSITLAWYFQDEANAYADSVQDSLAETGAVVPALWPLEVANILVIGERRGRSTVAQATSWIALLKGLPIRIDEETTSRGWTDTLSLARSQNFSVYDASYLELALRLGVGLATLDEKLKAAAAATGVPIYTFQMP